MTLEQLDKAMERDIQLHEEVRIVYIVDGWAAIYTPDDGNTDMVFRGESPIKALINCFQAVRNQKGRSH